MRDGVRKIDGLPILDELHLIPFKAKAWLELTERRNKGIRIDSADIRKHKRDIFRLCDVLAPDALYRLPGVIEKDLIRYITEVQATMSTFSLKDRKAEQERLEKLTQIFSIHESLFSSDVTSSG